MKQDFKGCEAAMAMTRRGLLVSGGAIAALSSIPLPAEPQAANPIPNTTKNLSDAEAVCLTDFEPLAKKKMAPMGWEYMIAGAADELTLKWNTEAYQRIRLKPRVLVDVSRLDTRITLFGQEHAFPILLAPVAGQKLAHPDGELATARRAGNDRAFIVADDFADTTPVECAYGWRGCPDIGARRPLRVVPLVFISPSSA